MNHFGFVKTGGRLMPINFCLKGFFQKSFQKGERCPFSLFERKRTKKKQTNVPLDRLSNGRRSAQSPMKLRKLRSSVLCGNPYLVRAFASRGCADGASVSPTPSSFPSFICLQIPCSVSRTVAPVNFCLSFCQRTKIASALSFWRERSDRRKPSVFSSRIS